MKFSDWKRRKPASRSIAIGRRYFDGRTLILPETWKKLAVAKPVVFSQWSTGATFSMNGSVGESRSSPIIVRPEHTDSSRRSTPAAADKLTNTSTPCKVMVAHTRLPSVGFRSWSRFLVVDVSHKPGGRLPLLSARPAVTPTTLKRAAIDFAAWWTEAQWVWRVSLRLLPDSVATAIWTRDLLRQSPAR